MNLYGEPKHVIEALRRQAQATRLEVVGAWTLWDVVVRHVGAYHGARCDEWLEDLSELSLFFAFDRVITQPNLRAFEDKPRLVRLLKHWGLVRAVSESKAGLYDGLQAYERELAEEADDAA